MSLRDGICGVAGGRVARIRARASAAAGESGKASSPLQLARAPAHARPHFHCLYHMLLSVFREWRARAAARLQRARRCRRLPGRHVVRPRPPPLCPSSGRSIMIKLPFSRCCWRPINAVARPGRQTAPERLPLASERLPAGISKRAGFRRPRRRAFDTLTRAEVEYVAASGVARSEACVARAFFPSAALPRRRVMAVRSGSCVRLRQPLCRRLPSRPCV